MRVIRRATHEEALRLIANESWCEKHTRPAVVAFDALRAALFIIVDGERAAEACADCEIEAANEHRL